MYALLAPMAIGVIPGVGPVTQERLGRIGLRTVADLWGCGRGLAARDEGQPWS